MGVILSVNNSLVCDPIEKFGNEDQKKRFLVPLARGERLGCFALTEPDAGSDAGNQKTRAVREGDAYRISGQKVFITCGSAADVCLLFAMTNPEKKIKGISAFLVDAGTKGFDRSRHQVKLGVNASGTVEIFLTDVMVPAADRLGAEGDGFKIAMSTLDGGRIGIASQAVGIAEEALEAAVLYAKARKAFGRPIAEFQALRFYLADMATEVDAARLLTRKAAAAKDEARKNGGRYSMEAAIAKLYAAEMAQRVTTKALQIHGGYGYTKEYPVERNFRDARDPPADHREGDLSRRGPGDRIAENMGQTRMFRDRVVSMEQTFEGGEKHLPLLKSICSEALPDFVFREHSLDHERDLFVMDFDAPDGARRRVCWTRMVLFDAERIPTLEADPAAALRARIVALVRGQAAAARPEILVTFRHLEEGWVDTPEPRREGRRRRRGGRGGRGAERAAGSGGRPGGPRERERRPGGGPSGGPPAQPQRGPAGQRPGAGGPERRPSGPVAAPEQGQAGAGGKRRRRRRRRGRGPGGGAPGPGAPQGPRA
jgi:butyryl-CoA dehydrogenase